MSSLVSVYLPKAFTAKIDVNVSMKKEDDDKLGTRVEMKNINSFSTVKEVIEVEIKRQTEILERGEKVIQETRRIDEDGKTYSMREKVDAVDYKYYIEPNLAPVKITDEMKQEVKKCKKKWKNHKKI